MQAVEQAADRGDRPTLRAARDSDLPAVERLLRAAQLPTVGVAEAFTTFVVAEHGTEIVGVAGLELRGDNALLRSVAVVPAWQHHGLGRELVERAIALAERCRLHAMYLLTTTAARYFPAFGFEPTDRQSVPSDIRESPEFTGACPASALAMVRFIDGSARLE
jgi:N-acetylglutamate synthase-like GNAT family acetyltransferase